MGPADRKQLQHIQDSLEQFGRHNFPLIGMNSPTRRKCYAIQLIESIRRVKYFSVIMSRQVDPNRANPASDLYDPHKAAIYYRLQGSIEESFWQAFISVHFGKHRHHGWRCAKAVFGGLGEVTWDWKQISPNPEAFRKWLSKSQSKLWYHRGFGNHRKYISLDAHSAGETGEAFVTYVNWVNTAGSHQQLMQLAQNTSGNDPYKAFEHLFKSMNCVSSFGRTGRFDYLTMLGKLELADISPGSPYLTTATGPLRGARLAFCGTQTSTSLSARQLDKRVIALGNHLTVGMQEMEDSLCNWQKSPDAFEPFRG